MITQDESTFSTNDGRGKLWTLDGHGILQTKKKKKNHGVGFSFTIISTQSSLITSLTTKRASQFKSTT